VSEQYITDVRQRFYDAVSEANGAINFALAVFDPHGLDGNPIVIAERHKAAAINRLEDATALLFNARMDYESSLSHGHGMGSKRRLPEKPKKKLWKWKWQWPLVRK